MYVIGHIIYGFPLTEAVYTALVVHAIAENPEDYSEWDLKQGDVPEDLIKDLLPDASEMLLPHMETVYSGNADVVPGWFGIKLGSIDECAPVLVKSIKDMEYNFTDALFKNARTQVHNMWDHLPAVVREAGSRVDLYIVWGTS